MATASQFLANPKINPVAVVSGANNALISYCLSTIIDSLSSPSVYRMTHSSLSLAFLSQIPSPVEPPRLIIVGGFDNASSETESLIRRFTVAATPNVYLALICSRARDDDRKRWLDGLPVQYIDCGNMTEAGLIRLVRSSGISEEEAVRVLDVCSWDIDSAIEYMELASIFREKPPINLVYKSSEYGILNSFFIRPAGNSTQIFWRVYNRLRQMIMLSEMDRRVSSVEAAKRIEVEPFLVKKLRPLSTQLGTDEMMAKLIAISRLFNYRNSPGFIDSMELVLCSQIS